MKGLSLPILGDLWDAFNGIFGKLPKEVKFLFGLALFLYAGTTLLKALIFIWNLLVVGSINLANGCLTDASLCIQPMDGIYLWGINVADYWTITWIVVTVPIALFAIKWYSLVLKR